MLGCAKPFPGHNTVTIVRFFIELPRESGRRRSPRDHRSLDRHENGLPSSGSKSCPIVLVALAELSMWARCLLMWSRIVSSRA